MHSSPADLAEIKRILTFWAPGIPAYAFGSRVHGRGLKVTSDLDVCLRDTRPVPKKILRQVRDAFEISDLAIRVDVVDWHDLTPDFQQLIGGDLERIDIAAPSGNAGPTSSVEGVLA